MPLDQDGRQSTDRTLGQLVAQASEDIGSIVRQEIALAKVEIQGSLTHVKKGLPLLIGAAVLVPFALGLLFTAAAWGINAAGLPIWASFLIVGGALLVIAAILAFVGQKALSLANPKPTRAIANAEETISALKSAQQTGSTHAKAIPASRSEVPLPPAGRRQDA